LYYVDIFNVHGSMEMWNGLRARACKWSFNNKYYLQHERPCCIGYTISSRRREFVYPIQHGHECCKWLKKRLILWVHWRSNFKNKRCLSQENQSKSLCKSTWICITYTDTTRLWFFFVFSSWIINEFFNDNNNLENCGYHLHVRLQC
jgi:hypothetical protein